MASTDDLRWYTALEAKVTAMFKAEYLKELPPSLAVGKAPPHNAGFSCLSTKPQTANALGLQVRCSPSASTTRWDYR